MAQIETTATGYRSFIQSFRAAFRGRTQFVAEYGDKPRNKFEFNVVGDGSLKNLYLTRVGRDETWKSLSDHEQRYTTGAVGKLTRGKLEQALKQDYVTSFAAYQSSFEIVLLCTVEAARSEAVYQRVQAMLGIHSPAEPSGDDIKGLAQMYGKVQDASGVTKSGQFKPLQPVDYVSYYKTLENVSNRTTLGQQFVGLPKS